MQKTRRSELRHLNFAGAVAAHHGGGAHLPSPRPAPRRGVDHAVCERPDVALDPFIAWALGRAGLDAANYRAAPLQRRLPACLRALRVSSASDARRVIEQRPVFLHVALEALLLGVTEFFRDGHVFDELRSLLPTIAEQGRGLRVWSVSCSVGCELCSIGILLWDLGLLESCQLLGTDCRSEALISAERGSYSEIYLRKVPPAIRGLYFEPDGQDARVREPLRSQIRWRHQDVCLEVGHEVWDVILWRNTAMYLKCTTACSIWNRLASSLRPGGLLVTGKAERPDCDTPLTRLADCIYTRAI